MHEGQFIQFTTSLLEEDACNVLPVVFGHNGVAFFTPIDIKFAYFNLIDLEGNSLTGDRERRQYNTQTTAGVHAGKYAPDMAGVCSYEDYINGRFLFPAVNISQAIPVDKCFRIKCWCDSAKVADVSNFSMGKNVLSSDIGHELDLVLNIEGLVDVKYPAGNYKLNFIGSKLSGQDLVCNGTPSIKVKANETTIYEGEIHWTELELLDPIEIEFSKDVPFSLRVEVNCGTVVSVGEPEDTFAAFDIAVTELHDLYQENNTFYSNVLRRFDDDDPTYAKVEYECSTPTFDMPFEIGRRVRQSLPIWLNKPQFQQNDEIYKKLDGEQIVLYATVNREVEAQTDYLPEWWHQRIILALSCDRVYINGERLTKSDNYEIDWDNHMTDDDGRWRAKAKWKMTGNITSRNSNN